MQGTLKWFDRKRGFGFIKPDEAGDDIYLNRGSFDRDNTLRQVDTMTERDASESDRRAQYEIEDLGDGRARAKNVAPLA